MSKEPRYTSQRMIGAANNQPAIAPWLYAVKLYASRFFGLILTVADALISYQGIRSGGAGWLPAATGAIFIALFQASMWLALTSGQPVGERFKARFFEDVGIIGVVKRIVGIGVVVLGFSFYAWDVGTNYAAFTGGQWVPIREGEALTMGTVMVIAGYVLLAIAFSLGDELLHILSDENAVGQKVNAVRRQGQIYDAELLSQYQQHYLKTAKPVADHLGADHGSRWRPRDVE